MVHYYNEDIKFNLDGKSLNDRWLDKVATTEQKILGDISIIFCSDDYILNVNEKYLDHHYYTDIITFNYNEGDTISGDLFISIDSVKDNANFFNTEFRDELDRVMVHGILHLIGYDDHTDADQEEMTSKENFYLNLRDFSE